MTTALSFDLFIDVGGLNSKVSWAETLIPNKQIRERQNNCLNIFNVELTKEKSNKKEKLYIMIMIMYISYLFYKPKRPQA
jgi:hypothetical protein